MSRHGTTPVAEPKRRSWGQWTRELEEQDAWIYDFSSSDEEEALQSTNEVFPEREKSTQSEDDNDQGRRTSSLLPLMLEEMIHFLPLNSAGNTHERVEQWLEEQRQLKENEPNSFPVQDINGDISQQDKGQSPNSSAMQTEQISPAKAMYGEETLKEQLNRIRTTDSGVPYVSDARPYHGPSRRPYHTWDFESLYDFSEPPQRGRTRHRSGSC
ncbi:MAG: hypothetical protein Q9164_000748 [Protoblastenia rupestris]